MTMIKGIHSTDHIKKNNLQLIWSLILENQPVSRATLSNLSDLSFVSVSNNVDFLLEQKIIQEVGTSETQRGRPPVLLRVNPECGVIVGVSEEFQQNSYIVTNILGEILEEYFIVHDSDSGSTFLEQLQNEIAKISKKYSNFPLGIIGIGLAHSGDYIAREDRIFSTTPNISEWVYKTNEEALQRATLNNYVFTTSLTCASVLGEQAILTNISSSDVLVNVHCGYGLSVGVYLGSYGNIQSPVFTTLFNHTTINFNGKKCNCGNQGCLVEYASLRELCKSLNIKKDFSNSLIEEIAGQYRAGDRNTVIEVSKLVDYLSIGLLNIMYAYQPQVITLTGPIVHIIDSALLKRINSYIEKHSSRSKVIPQIICSPAQNASIASGCCVLVRRNIIDIICDSSPKIVRL